MAAELRLNVSLDLGFFRQQLQKLTVVAQSEFAPKLNVKFDRATLGKELKALTKVLDKAVVLKVSDSQLEGARLRLSKLNKSIALFRRANEQAIQIKVKYVEEGKAPTGTIAKSGTFRQRLEKTETESIKQLYKAAGEAGIVQFNDAISSNKGKIVTALNQAGEDSVTGLINGLKSKDAAVKNAAKSMGDVLIAALKMSLQIQSPSKKMEAIGEDSGAGFSKGLTESLADAKDAAVVKMRQLVAALRFEAAKMQGVFPGAGGLGAGTGRLSALRTQEGRLSSQVGRLSGASGMMQGTRGVAPAGARQALTGATAALPSLQLNLKTVRGQIIDELFSAASSKGEISSSVARNVSNDIGRGISSALSPAIARTSTGAVRGRIPTAGMARREVAAGPMGIFETSTLSLTATEYLNDARRVLGLPMGPSSPIGSMGQFPMSGMMGRGSMGQFPVDPMLAVGGASAMGQKIAGPYPFSNTARSARGGYIPGIRSSAFFPMSGIMGPSSPLGPITPQSSMFAGGGAPPSAPPGGPPGGGGGRGAGFFGGMQFNMPNLPGSGVMQELGQEFGFAAKQVLLFGTAYKALAFIQTFPAQVGEAVGALQSFRNTIGEISPTAKEAAASSQFILDIVDKYNVPLQSARDGFVKLYASMQPAGFSGDEIRDLFLGISQTAATFGMSADKVDRVNYAFAQMASKGQVMSEELKGQLGDVLPGAMAIFAEAAGFKGPEAISKFSEALEDGVYKGGAMKTLLKNVGIIMRQEFGPGAEGAARTFQGVMNRMQNSTKLLYESFEPVAVGFLNAVVMPMTNGIKTITDGFNAFFAGTATKTAGGFAFAKELEKLRPSFEGIAQNVRQLLPVLQSFGNTLLAIGKTFIAIAGNPFTGFLLRAYAAVLPLTAAIRILNLQALIPLIASLLRAVPAFVAFTVASARGATVLQAVRVAMASTGQTGVVAAGQIRLFSTTLKAAFASTVIGLVVLGIGMIIERMMSLGARMDEVRSKAMGAAQAIRGMSQVEARIAGQQAQRDIKLIEDVSKRKPAKGTKGQIPVTAEEAAALERGGVVPQLSRKALPGAERRVVNVTDIPVARQERESTVKESEYRVRQVKFEEQQGMQPVALAPITGTGAASVGSNAKKAASDAKKEASEAARQAEQLMGAEMQLNLARQLFAIENRIIAARFEGNKPLELARETQKQLAQIAGEAAAIKANKDMPAAQKLVELDRLKVRSAEAARSLAVDIAQIEIDRNKSFDQIIADLDLELALKSATTEQAREQLRLEAEIAKLKGQGFTPEQLDVVQQLKSELATAETPTQKIYSQMQKDLQDLVAIENVARDGAKGIGDAFGAAFQSILSGSASAQEALAGMMKSIGENFLSMAAQIIAQQVTMIIFGTIMKALGVSMPGGGGGGGFGGAPSAPAVDFGFTPSFGSGFAKGGVFHGGELNAYAKGGIVDSPTFFKFANGGQMANGLMGEAGPEAIMPLQRGADGKLGVQANGLREAMDRDRYNTGSNAPILNMSFESTTIGGVEYVSRDQLEQAMAETRRNATRDGAQRGMSMTLDKLQQSPSTRRRIGV